MSLSTGRYKMIRYKVLVAATGEIHTKDFTNSHDTEAYIINHKLGFPRYDRIAALELVNKWNRLSRGTYIYWID